ncbi:DedA family protein [Nesterenkonia ebinurensis]|uniref:DedA family protein n=1 Tax=Nesterenkonia ebinurensis TaxID=2608252 RepID=UPI00123CA6A9|nr:VTT domain-containing protein [Nesterenkonia ebinurensis]
MHEILSSIESAVVALGPSPWLLLAVLVLSCIDGFFPPVPSESIVIAAAVLAVAGDMSAGYLVLLVLAAAVGAFLGDLIAYSIGSRVPVDRLRMLRGPRGQAVLTHTQRALAERGSTFILTGRFIPVGRVAVNMTAGALAFRLTRFLPLAGLASLLWAVYCAAMGIGAGHLLSESPLLAMALGVLSGVLAGLLLDRLIRWFQQPSQPAAVAHTPVCSRM